ncbi:hypothetical protein AAZX31_11G050600 [Glycine max]|uniref:Maternal effect embryo arrest 59 n=1 Tax=Glycine soja TaxID=3848 RepID=A0A445HXA4_GLYSO|nr:uncharacterized protein LOC100805584 isoform X1 [Glycine max]XP_028186876.1 uncharacterized protein LOC114373582 isoform X1 [Glycine soja]KAG4386475.1 hypothetical protein GLYMA_11G051900v4 [Glycine max]KAG4987770.1 hypothetical protein JHK85_030753 [Glycine max]KAG5123390.1 hypothetical protein JHK82_030127 [Glycine max]KAH1223717.1 hypothetical protein GmHk_11G031121 [Glycine max]RZB78440.1 hypothetical protein D0Y65_029033 [Glycine soja]|eukprot:XP_003538803.1 uncharacterized protein LOC100805584 isoform X1 [Glycine max]
MMVEQLAVAKPSRPSDEVQVRIANEIRAEFDALEPKRPIKPNRSEPDAVLQHPPDASVNNIPELHKFRSLQSRSHAIISSAGIVDAHDEFVETQYYKELAAIDKQHHTTGSGFIKAVREGGEGGYEIHVNAAETQPRGYKSNPATNDWVPNSEEYQVFVSSKPNRRRVLDDIAR